MANDIQSEAKKIIGSTARILVGLAQAMLDAKDLPENDPINIAIKKFVVINCRTAQMARIFTDMPDISHTREKVEVSLNKLGTIKNQTATTNHVLFTNQYKAPGEKTKQELLTLDTLRTDYKNLIAEQHSGIKEIMEILRTASDPLLALNGPDVKGEFSNQDAQREKLQKTLLSLGNEIKTTNVQLEGLFNQVFNSIPVMNRAEVTQKIAPPASPDENRPE